MLPYTYRVTKYDPADRDEHGHYTGPEDVSGDDGPVDAAYVAAAAAFAEDAGVDRLEIREPEAAGGDAKGVEGLFPAGLAGFHDGAEVPVARGLELVRAMVSGSEVWCRLKAEGKFFVHVGWDQYMYVGSGEPCDRAIARTRALGLFPERIEVSPYDQSFDEPADSGEQRPADDTFWNRLDHLIASGGPKLLEERPAYNVTRWHRLTGTNTAAIRAHLAPRAQLAVWTDLSTDIDAVRGAFTEDDLVEVVWEDEDGGITGLISDETRYAELMAQLTRARSAALLPMTVDGRHPLLTAVLPDNDRVLRARWRTDRTPADAAWAVLRAVRRGQVRQCVVVRIHPFGVFVDLGGAEGLVRVPEMSWDHVGHPAAVVEVGQEITAVVIDVDMVRELVTLSMKALREKPCTPPC